MCDYVQDEEERTSCISLNKISHKNNLPNSLHTYESSSPIHSTHQPSYLMKKYLLLLLPTNNSRTSRPNRPSSTSRGTASTRGNHSTSRPNSPSITWTTTLLARRHSRPTRPNTIPAAITRRRATLPSSAYFLKPQNQADNRNERRRGGDSRGTFLPRNMHLLRKRNRRIIIRQLPGLRSVRRLQRNPVIDIQESRVPTGRPDSGGRLDEVFLGINVAVEPLTAGDAGFGICLLRHQPPALKFISWVWEKGIRKGDVRFLMLPARRNRWRGSFLSRQHLDARTRDTWRRRRRR